MAEEKRSRLFLCMWAYMNNDERFFRTLELKSGAGRCAS